MKHIINYILFFMWSISTPFGSTFVISPGSDLVGEVQYTRAQPGENLIDVGLRYNIGYNQMVQANSQFDPAKLLLAGEQIRIPSQYILPKGPREGVVINLAEYRLYFYPPNDNVVITNPIGIGRDGWETPVGMTKITSKVRNPVWRPTANLKIEALKQDRLMPNEFPAGPGNPLGKYALRLGWPTYLIHGTNQSLGIGMRVSAGCIRMLPEDIENLFDLISVGTPIKIVNQPIKTGVHEGITYMEAHPPQLNKKTELSKAKAFIASLNIGYKLIKENAEKELNAPSGIPIKIS